MVLGGLQIGDFLRKKISGKSLQGKKKSLNQDLKSGSPAHIQRIAGILVLMIKVVF